jgi:hypothetical protein
VAGDNGWPSRRVVAVWDRWPSTGWVAKDRDGWLSGIGGQVQDRRLRTEMCG